MARKVRPSSSSHPQPAQAQAAKSGTAPDPREALLKAARSSRDKNLVNLLRKLQSGGTLSAGQLALIDEASNRLRQTPLPQNRPVRWSDSMAAAAAVSGQPLELFKKAKRLGAPGFKGSRVSAELVLKFVAENPEKFTTPAGCADLKDQKLNEEVRKLRLSNDQKEAKLVPRAAGAEAIRKTIGLVGPILEQKLQNELPTVMAGIDPSQGRVYGKRLTDEILLKFQDCERFWKI